MTSRWWTYGAVGAAIAAGWASFGPKPDALAVPTPSPDAAAPTAFLQAPASPSAPTTRVVLAPALRNAFAIVAPPPPPAPPAPPPVKVVEAPPPPPAPPPLNLRYAGRMTAPDGTPVVFALYGNESVVLTPGLALANGYRVERVTDAAVELLYPPLGATARLDVPAAPTFEVR
jgi:hypothetical protein